MSSLSPPQPSPSPPNPPPPDLTPAYTSFLHNTSLTMLFLAPVLIALPPRKLDLYTFGLTAGWVASANHLTKERNPAAGGILSRFAGMPKRAAETSQDEEAQQKMRGRILEEQMTLPVAANTSSVAGKKSSGGIEEQARELWMGGEREGWKERRLKEEQEKLDQGEGYGGMIMDQIWEVWNWGEKKGEELKGKDEQVLRDRRREEEFPTIGKAKKKG